MAAVYCSNALRCPPPVVKICSHLHQFSGIRGLDMVRKQHLYDCLTEVLHTTANCRNTNAKKVTHTPVLIVGGQSPQGDGNPFIHRHGQTVVRGAGQGLDDSRCN